MYHSKNTCLKNENYPEILNKALLEKSKAEEHLGNYKEALVNYKQNKITCNASFTPHTHTKSISVSVTSTTHEHCEHCDQNQARECASGNDERQ